MSINSNMRPFTLKKQSGNVTALKTPTGEFVTVATIDAAINYTHSVKIVNDIAYKSMQPQAVTYYTAFVAGEKYIIESAEHKFNIESILYNGRQSILMLSEATK